MKPKVIAGIAVGFVLLIAGLILVGPEVIDRVAGPQKPPPPQPIARPAPVTPPPPTPPTPPAPAEAADAGVAPVVVAPPPPPPEPPPEKPAKVEPVGYLTVTTTPPGLTVIHRGNELGKTPLKRQALPVGKQALALMDAKGKKKLFAVTVREGKEQKVNLSWAKLK